MINIDPQVLLIINLFLSALIGAFLILPVKSFGCKYGFFDEPSNRKEHKVKLTRVGGIAIVTTSLITMAIASTLYSSQHSSFADSTAILSTIIVCSACFFFIGLIDDIYSISPWPRLALGGMVSFYSWRNGLSIDSISFPFLDNFLSPINLSWPFSLLITILWICGIVNAINWIDGLDGLAAKVSGLILLGFLSFNLFNNQIYLCIIAASIAGSCIGFLFHNSHPATILMGDSGSYFLGYNIAALSIPIANPESFYNNINNGNFLLPLLLLIYPISDMLIVILKRIYSRLSPFYPDRNHFHHFLIDFGYTHSMSVHLISSLNFLIIFITLILFKAYTLFSLVLFLLYFLLSSNIKLLSRKNN